MFVAAVPGVPVAAGAVRQATRTGATLYGKLYSRIWPQFLFSRLVKLSTSAKTEIRDFDQPGTGISCSRWRSRRVYHFDLKPLRGAVRPWYFFRPVELINASTAD